MIVNPMVLDVAEQQTATIHLVIPGVDMPRYMDPAITEVFEALSTLRMAPIGPLFSYHHRRPSDTFDFEIGVPIDQPFAATGRVRPSAIPACRVFRVTYVGPYDGLGPAWQESSALLEAAGHRSAGTFWESYVTDPTQEPDSSAWRTELNWVILA